MYFYSNIRNHYIQFVDKSNESTYRVESFIHGHCYAIPHCGGFEWFECVMLRLCTTPVYKMGEQWDANPLMTGY